MRTNSPESVFTCLPSSAGLFCSLVYCCTSDHIWISLIHPLCSISNMVFGKHISHMPAFLLTLFFPIGRIPQSRRVAKNLLFQGYCSGNSHSAAF